MIGQEGLRREKEGGGNF